MARIRTIKPEIWTDEKFGPLDPVSKLVFIGLISQADDAGRILDSVRLIDGLLFAYDDSTSVRRSLDELSRTGLIRRGETDSGQRIIQIAKWDQHQKIDRPNLDAALQPIAKPLKDLQGFDEGSSKDRRSLDEDSSARSTTYEQDLRPTTDDLRPPSPSPRETVEKSDPLTEWLGEHAELVADCPLVRDREARKAIHAQFGPPEMRANAWKQPDGTAVPPEDRPRILAAALLGYAGEGNSRIIVSEFAGLLRRTIHDEVAEPSHATTGSPDLSHWED